MKFFSGCSSPYQMPEFDKYSVPILLSVNALFKKRGLRYVLRRSPLSIKGEWMMDSGAFTRISQIYGFKNYLPVKKYAQIIKQFTQYGNCLGAVSQDYMCEPFILDVTGLDIPTHQRLTIHRYDRLLNELENPPVAIIPVIQGYDPNDYIDHIRQYGQRLTKGMWVGVGSVCKRNSNPESVRQVLLAIKSERPDLRLHGFGLKLSCLRLGGIRDLLYSADSAAADLWSKPGDRKTRKYQNSNNVNHAIVYRNQLNTVQLELPFLNNCTQQKRGGD